MSYLDVAARNAEQLAQFARRNSLAAEAIFDVGRSTWLCLVETPWRDEPRAAVRDKEDVSWVVAELDHEETRGPNDEYQAHLR